jgi:hypothetical protein
MRELAAREGVGNSYVSRMVNLTMLPPWTIAAILVDTLPDDTILFDMAVDPPLVWELVASFRLIFGLSGSLWFGH